MSQNMGQQIISVGAATCGTFLELIIAAAELRQQARDASVQASFMQAEATKADGDAQQAALNQEASTRSNMSMQSLFEGASQLGGEGLSVGSEMKAHWSGAKARATVDALQKWDDHLTKLDLGKRGIFSATKTNGQIQQLEPLTAKEVAEINPAILRKEGGEIKTPAEYFQNKAHETAFEKAAESRDKSYLSFKKELRRQLKDARSESENISQSGQRWGTRFKDCARSVDAGARYVYNAQSATAQSQEAMFKNLETNAKFSSEMESSSVRIAQGTADNQSSLIQSLQQAKSEIDQSNSRG
jgi:hypothetical protein